MSNANVDSACAMAQLDPERWVWHIRIGAEREKGPDGDIYRQALVDLERMVQGNAPSPTGPFAWLVRGKVAGWIAAAMVAGGLSVAPAGNQAVAASVADADLYIMRTSRRRRRPSLRDRLQQLFCITPVAQPGASVAA